MDKFKGVLRPEVRKWIYGILLAVFPVICFYYPPLIPAAPLWLALAMAVLNVNEPQESDNG